MCINFLADRFATRGILEIAGLDLAWFNFYLFCSVQHFYSLFTTIFSCAINIKDIGSTQMYSLSMTRKTMLLTIKLVVLEK